MNIVPIVSLFVIMVVLMLLGLPLAYSLLFRQFLWQHHGLVYRFCS